MDIIRNCLLPFQRVSLADLDKVKLMNRTDLKFCLHIEKLPAVLEAIRSEYLLLEINGETIFNYDNTYFDTSDNQMFICHHNGKSNRFKIRMRKYVESKINFLEIKLKNNKGRTIKERVVKQEFKPEFNDIELIFLDKVSPFAGLQLEPKIKNHFSRFTMVNKLYTERVTVDMAPSFKNPDNEITLNNLVIIEIKQSKSSDPAIITKVLREMKIKNQGFSKYCVGRSLLEENMKKNNFKPLLLKIRKEYLN
jgi:hypothetical protein